MEMINYDGKKVRVHIRGEIMMYISESFELNPNDAVCNQIKDINNKRI